MNTLWKFSRLLALVLSFQSGLCAATADVAKFSGTVVDAQGNPVAGAAVDYYQLPMRPGAGFDWEAKQQVVTDSHGAFELSAIQGQCVLLVTKAGMAPGWRTLYSAQPETQKIVLSAPATLAGTVVDDGGRPVADAEVWVSTALNKDMNDNGQPSFIFGKIVRGLFSTRTSADGKFRIENFPASAQAGLTVTKTGLAMHQNSNPMRFDQLPFHAGQEDITLTLDPAGSVTGKVVVRGTGQPLASASVGLMPTAAGMGFSGFGNEPVFSAADGSFQIHDVLAGSYNVMAIFTNQPLADWVADPVPVTVAAGQTVPDVQIQANKGGVLTVTVREKRNHELIADAVVNINSPDYNRAGSTGANGMASFRLPPGQFNVFVTKQGWSPAQSQATATDGQTTAVTIDLGEPLKIRGIVRNSAGAPVAGASLSVVPNYWDDGAGLKSDADGHYDVSWQKPAWAGQQNQRFYLLARQADQNLAALQEVNDTTTNLDVTLKPAMSVSGQVQDAHGKAITNVMAYISIHQENSSFTITRRPVLSDGQGRFQATALPAGERYGWYLSAPGYGSGHEEMEVADPKADHYDFPPLVLKLANLKLAGRVLGADGKPAAGVQVWMNGDGQPNGNATTDADGRFVYDAVCAGPITVSANGKGSYGSADAVGGDTNVVIRFEGNNNFTQPAPLTLTGNVFDPSGNHAVGAVVCVTPSWGPISTVKTDDNGDFSINWQSQPGMRGAKYFVIARDLGKNLAAIEGIDNNSTHVSLRLQPALSISGTVEDRQGAPLVHANVNLNLMAGNMGGMVEYEPVRLDSTGAFTIPALPMGQQYNLYVTAQGYGSGQKFIGINQSQTNSIQLPAFKLKAANRPLAGKVVDKDNKPVPGAQVSINGNGQPNGNMRSDENGKFKFTVCDGPVRIFAWGQPGQGREFGNVEVSGGDQDVVVKLGEQRQRQTRTVFRATPLKPQPWTVGYLLAWPASHKTASIILLSLQATLLLGTSSGIFWYTRRRR